MEFIYETHLHSSPASRCAKASVEESLRFYKAQNYDGVFLTNHFLCGNIGCDRSLPYQKQLDFYLKDYEDALELGARIGLKVFFGVELSRGGTDFLIYGLSPDWYRAHPEIMEMQKSAELAFMRSEGALVVHAHPFREASYIDHIRLYPRYVDAVEVINANNCKPFENEQGKHYAEVYGLRETAGSDNHWADRVPRLAGVISDRPFSREEDYMDAVKNGSLRLFLRENK